MRWVTFTALALLALIIAARLTATLIEILILPSGAVRITVLGVGLSGALAVAFVVVRALRRGRTRPSSR